MKELLVKIFGDLKNYSKGSVLRSILVISFNMSFQLTLNYRLGRYLHERRNMLTNIIIMYLKRKQIKKYGCDISYQAQIGENIKFPHPIGIVIGTGSIIKDNVKIWQHVTLGSKGGTEKKYPIIENNVKIYSNSQVIGGILIENNSVIGASSVVFIDIPRNKTAVGVPAKIIN